jgi:phosphatidylglycerol:prolipoprotein diacylglycerol transferase
VKVHPTPIYEFLQGLFVFGILWSLGRKKLAPGTIAWLYLVLAGLMRFIVEFWRINPRVDLGLSEAQLISLALIAVGLLLLAIRPIRQTA